MKYEITIHQFEDFTEEEKEKMRDRRLDPYSPMGRMDGYNIKKTIRVTSAELTEEEFHAVRKAIIGAV